MLRLLGQVRLDGAQRRLTAQEHALVAFLQCCGPVGRPAIVEALWDGRPISDHRVANLLAEVRRVIGRRHLPDPVDGRYRLAHVTTDLDVVRSVGMEAADLRVSGAASFGIGLSQRLSKCLRGRPFGDRAGRYWTWVDDRPALLFAQETAIVDAVQAVADLLDRSGRPTEAINVVVAALECCPDATELVVDLVRLHQRVDRPRSAQRLVDAWEARMERLGCGPAPNGPRRALAERQAASTGTAVTTRLPR